MDDGNVIPFPQDGLCALKRPGVFCACLQAQPIFTETKNGDTFQVITDEGSDGYLPPTAIQFVQGEPTHECIPIRGGPGLIHRDGRYDTAMPLRVEIILEEAGNITRGVSTYLHHAVEEKGATGAPPRGAGRITSHLHSQRWE